MIQKNPNEADQLFALKVSQLVETHLGRNHVFTGSTLVAYAQHLAERVAMEAKNLKRRGARDSRRGTHRKSFGPHFRHPSFSAIAFEIALRGPTPHANS